jgi:uncharacterized protein with FMN-binding domain
MKRPILVAAGTLAGVAAVLAYHPGANAGMSALASNTVQTPSTNTQPTKGTTTTGGTPNPTASASATTGATTGKSGTYTGQAVNTQYGVVQVQVKVSNGKITASTGVALPQNDSRSAYISQQAGPMLNQEVLAVQSSQISGVSGATYTSAGYQQSLASALAQAGMS